MSPSIRKTPGMQFSIRTLLAVTAFFAVAAALWPKTNIEALKVLLAVFPLSLGVSGVLAVSAWSLCRGRGQTHSVNGKSQRYEQFNLACGLIAMVPYAAIWIMWMLDPFESTHRAVSATMVAMVYIAMAFWLPAIVLVTISLVLFFNIRDNPPLLMLRIIGLAVNLAWPVIFYFFIFPRLG